MTATTRRPLCSGCLRPLHTCLCKHVQTVNNQTQLIILQHPLEAKEAKNTAGLLHLCLNNSQLYIGEQFDDAFFIEVTANHSNLLTHPTYDVLLYPETEPLAGIQNPPLIDTSKLEYVQNISASHSVRLWVLDATWRKSRKMLYLNPALQRMPRLHLQNCPLSLYQIRKAHSENQLSTLEASCYALQQLEHHVVDYTPVLTAFAAFITQHKTFNPLPYQPMEPL